MIEFLALSIAIALLYFANQAFKAKEAFWFFHDVNTPFVIQPEDCKEFNKRIATTLLLFAAIFLIPTFCFIFHFIKEGLYIMIMCSGMTILIFVTMVYWHHLYKTYQKK